MSIFALERDIRKGRDAGKPRRNLPYRGKPKFGKKVRAPEGFASVKGGDRIGSRGYKAGRNENVRGAPSRERDKKNFQRSKPQETRGKNEPSTLSKESSQRRKRTPTIGKR